MLPTVRTVSYGSSFLARFLWPVRFVLQGHKVRKKTWSITYGTDLVNKRYVLSSLLLSYTPVPSRHFGFIIGNKLLYPLIASLSGLRLEKEKEK